MNFYSKNFLLIITTYYVRYNIIGDEINLIIGISTDSARVSPHFGRAPYFTFIEIENEKVIDKR
ncbi:MAG: NifB/NifX family molybdenum-iron cluster-binding protein, partial [Candidatus Hermodarchaeota archaeon]